MSGSDAVNRQAEDGHFDAKTSASTPGPVPAAKAPAWAGLTRARETGQRLLAATGTWAGRPQSGNALRAIPSRQHGTLDYVLGVILIALPYLGGFANRRGAEWVPVLVGMALIGYSLFTNYERGMMRVIPLSVHLRLDLGVGLILIVAGIFVSIRHRIGAGDGHPWHPVGGTEPGYRRRRRRYRRPAGSTGHDADGTKRPGMPPAVGPSDAAGRPAYPVPHDGCGTPEQVRGAINSGHTGDKVAMNDPAASPLGSDDEASDTHDEDGLRTAREAAEAAGLSRPGGICLTRTTRSLPSRPSVRRSRRNVRRTGLPMTCVMNTTVVSSFGSIQNAVAAAPPQKYSPSVPGSLVLATLMLTPQPMEKPTPA